MRLAVINLLTISLLLTLVARLLFLQVLASPDLKRAAARTSLRLIYSQAPRGFIFDRNSQILAQNRTALTVAVEGARLTGKTGDAVIPKLASLLGLPEAKVRAVVEDKQLGPYELRPLALDVNEDTVVYILEHQREFPGVTALEIPVREYPNQTLAAHALGHIGKISAEELTQRRKTEPTDNIDSDSIRRRYRTTDEIGKIGVERVYEDYLRGTPGVQKISINVKGEQVQEYQEKQPERGWDALLSLNLSTQKAAEESLAAGLELARRITDHESGVQFKAPAGAVVALNPANGEVLALASNPTFNPNIFVGSAPPEELARLNDPESQKPMFNRAISEATAPGSTFKPLTAAAAWKVGEARPESTFNCPGFIQVGNRRFKDWKTDGHGTIGLGRSLPESCDVVYYTLGVKMNERRREIGEHLQDVSREFGLGRKTGVDLLGENEGLVPDAIWKERRFERAQPYDRRWFPGDAANLAIGQGFLQVTPLQLAAAYSALANGGTVYRPHLLRCVAKLDVANLPQGDGCTAKGAKVPPSAKPKVVSQVEVGKDALEFISRSMLGVGVGEGTASSAFSGFPFDRVAVAGKTGTAQVALRQDFSWFAASAALPGSSSEIVVVAMVEEGGTGAQIAAPIVRSILEAHFDLPRSAISPGASAD